PAPAPHGFGGPGGASPARPAAAPTAGRCARGSARSVWDGGTLEQGGRTRPRAAGVGARAVIGRACFPDRRAVREATTRSYDTAARATGRRTMDGRPAAHPQTRRA